MERLRCAARSPPRLLVVVADSRACTSRNEQRQSLRRSRETDPRPRPDPFGTAPTICVAQAQARGESPRRLRRGQTEHENDRRQTPSPSGRRHALLVHSACTLQRSAAHTVAGGRGSEKRQSGPRRPGRGWVGGRVRGAHQDVRLQVPHRLFDCLAHGRALDVHRRPAGDPRALHLALVVVPEERGHLVAAGDVQKDKRVLRREREVPNYLKSVGCALAGRGVAVRRRRTGGARGRLRGAERVRGTPRA